MTAGTVLITGAEGFIGSHVTETLVRAGYNVRAMVLYNAMGSQGWLDRCAADVSGHFEVVMADVRDGAAVRSAVAGCRAVAHLAALISIPYSYRAPDSYIDTNVGGTLNVLQAARDLDVEKVLQTSTSEVYGSARFVPITEDHPLQAQSPYAASKIGADQLALSFFRSFGTPVTVLRPFNAYGPRQSTRAVIPTIATQILKGARSIKLGSLHPTRDFNFVTDIADGFLAALRAENVLGETFNLGSAFEISIGETAQLIAEIIGAEIGIHAEAERVRPEASEVDQLWASNAKARAMLGWYPEYAGLEGFRRGLQQTIEWFANTENLNLYRTDIYAV